MSLPSNSSMDVYPNNAAAEFTTKLSEVVELEGRWEVGLLETSFPGKVANVFGHRFSYVLRMVHARRIECMMSTGDYPSILSVVQELHHAYERLEGNDLLVRFNYFSRFGRMSFKFTGDADKIVSIEFIEDLAIMLGYVPNRLYRNGSRLNFRAEHPMHLSASIDNVYIYLSLIHI